jgi:DNA-binding ferritin-like protein (Dps family)
MQASALSELQRTSEIFAEMLEKFEKNYPQAWKEINQNLYTQADLNIADLMHLLQIFSEI